MLNFRKVVEFLFKSFDTGGDTKLIEKLESEGHRFLMIVKRHWFYGVLNSWRVIIVIIIALANSYLLLFSGEGFTGIGIGISIFLISNVLYWVFIIIIYLKKYYKIFGSEPYIEDIYSCLEKNKKADIAFTNFFNQTIFLLILLFITTIFTSVTSIFGLIGNTKEFGFGAVNGILLFIQMGVFYSYLGSMINLEMDFKVVIPNQIFFYNQRGVLGGTRDLNADKIKTMNTKYRGLLGSFFNYGDIIILTEGDQQNLGETHMDYIGNPTKTVKEMRKVLFNELELIESEVNILLKKFETQIGIKDINSSENKKRLKDFVTKNEDLMKELYEKGDMETKREIKELYVILNSN